MTTSPGPTARRRARVFVMAAVSVVLITAVVRAVDTDALTRTAASTPLSALLAAAAAALFFNTLQSAELLRAALATFGVALSWRATLAATVGSIGLQAVLPVGVGAAGRVAYLVRVHGAGLAPASAATAAILLAKLGWLCGLAAAGWLLRPTGSAWHGVALAGATAAVVGVAAGAGPLSRIAGAHLASPRLREVAASLSRSGDRASARAVSHTVAHALVAVAAEAAIFVGLLGAIAADADLVTAAARFPLCVIGGRVPVTLFGVGAREALVLVLMPGVASPEELLATALAFSVVEYVVPALLGTVVTGPFVHRALASADRTEGKR